MKLKWIAGWIVASVLGMSVLLAPGTASAGFETIDDFSEPYASEEFNGERGISDPDNVKFDNDDSNDRLIVIGSEGGGGMSGTPEVGETGIGADAIWLDYSFDSPLNGLSELYLMDATATGSDVMVTAWLYDSDDAPIWFFDADGEPIEFVEQTVPANKSERALQFSFGNVRGVMGMEFTFASASEEDFEFTSSSLGASIGASSAPQSTPEPTSLVLFGLASAGGGIAAWRKRRKALAV